MQLVDLSTRFIVTKHGGSALNLTRFVTVEIKRAVVTKRAVTGYFFCIKKKDRTRHLLSSVPFPFYVPFATENAKL